MAVDEMVARYYQDASAAVADWRAMIETFDDLFTLEGGDPFDDLEVDSQAEPYRYRVVNECGNLAGGALAESVRQFVRALQRVAKYVSTDLSERVDLKLLEEWAFEIDFTFNLTKSSEKLVGLSLRVSQAFETFAENVGCDSVIASVTDSETLKAPVREAQYGCDPSSAILFYQRELREAGAWNNMQNPGTLRIVFASLGGWLDDIARSEPIATKEKWWRARRELIGFAETLFHLGTAIKAAGAIQKLPITLEDLEAVRFVVDETVVSVAEGRLLEIGSPEVVGVPLKLCEAIARLKELFLVVWHYERMCPQEASPVVDPAVKSPDKLLSRWPEVDRDAIRDSLSGQRLKLFNVLWGQNKWTNYETLKSNRADKLWRNQPDVGSINDDTVFEALRKLQKAMPPDWPYTLTIENEGKRVKIIPPEKVGP